MCEFRRRLKRDSCPASSEGEIGGMLELQRRSEIEARAMRDHGFAAEVRFRQRGCELDTVADAGDSHRLPIRRIAVRHLVAHCEPVRVAELDMGRAGARTR